jgi:hypothetical protein
VVAALWKSQSSDLLRGGRHEATRGSRCSASIEISASPSIGLSPSKSGPSSLYAMVKICHYILIRSSMKTCLHGIRDAGGNHDLGLGEEREPRLGQMSLYITQSDRKRRRMSHERK